MRIEIVGDHSIGQQARTYAEYRVFAALAPMIDTRRCRQVSLALRRAKKPGRREGITCAVVIEMHDRRVARFEAGGDHPFEAINRAVECLGRSGDQVFDRDDAASRPASETSPR